MKTVLYTYSGTGNSLWCAKRLAGELGETEIFPIPQIQSDVILTEADAIGLVFPVHMWGVPGPVIDFVQRLKVNADQYVFALAVNAGQVAATLLQLEKLMGALGVKLSAGFSLVMPTNYVPWGGPGPVEKQNQRFRLAEEKIKNRITPAVRRKDVGPWENGPLWQNVLFTVFYKMAFPHIGGMDKDFWVDEKCTACKICEKVCPARNIQMQSGKPVWQHRCEQCLACIQWCPEAAIQYGKKTPRYPRYHHPEIKVADIMQSAPKR